MKQKIILIIIFCVELLSLKSFTACEKFKEHYSTLDLELRLIEGIHADSAVSILETRIFHNKVLYTFLDTFNIYLGYLNISFLTSFISLVGAVGLLLGIYYWVKNKKKPLYSKILLSLLIIMPLLEILNLIRTDMTIKVAIFSLPFIFWSLYGYYHHLQKPDKKKYILVSILIVLSIWFIAAGGQNLQNFCLLTQ